MIIQKTLSSEEANHAQQGLTKVSYLRKIGLQQCRITRKRVLEKSPTSGKEIYKEPHNGQK